MPNLDNPRSLIWQKLDRLSREQRRQRLARVTQWLMKTFYDILGLKKGKWLNDDQNICEVFFHSQQKISIG